MTGDALYANDRNAATEAPRTSDLITVGIILIAALAAFAAYFWRLAAGDTAGANDIMPLIFALSCVYLCFEAPRRRSQGVRAIAVLVNVNTALLCLWALVQIVQLLFS